MQLHIKNKTFQCRFNIAYRITEKFYFFMNFICYTTVNKGFFQTIGLNDLKLGTLDILDSLKVLQMLGTNLADNDYMRM
jgi:hypothetical protein